MADGKIDCNVIDNVMCAGGNSDIITENQLITLSEKVDSGKVNVLRNLLSKKKKSQLDNLFKYIDKTTGKKHKQEDRDKVYSVLNKYIEEYLKTNYVKVSYIHSKNLTEPKIGRKYANKSLGLQSFMGSVRDYLLTDSNNDNEPLATDIDIKNAHPCIAYNIAKDLKLECETLKEYIFNREEFFKSYTDTGDYTKNHIKKVIISMLNSQHINKKQSPYDDKLKALDKEFKTIQEVVYKADKYANMRGFEDTTKNNQRGSFLNIILCCEENRILTALYNCLINNNYKVNSLIFDGLLVQGNHYANTELLELCNKAVDILPNVKIELAYKPLNSIILDYFNELEDTDEDNKEEDEDTELKKDKEKQDLDWVNELMDIIPKDTFFTDNAGSHYYRSELGGQYVKIEKTGLHAELFRIIQNIYKNKSYFKSANNISRIANTYLLLTGKLNMDTSIFDTKNIGVPFNNGVFNNETGNIDKADAKDFVCNTTGYELRLYDYSNPDVKKLDELLMNCFNEADHNYYKFHIGNLLLGNHKQFYILYGSTGNNGKTKCFCEVLNLAFNALCASMKQDHISSNKRSQVEGASPETMILKSSFVNIISELNDDTQLDANAIKNLSGGNRMTAREMYNGTIHSFTMKGTMLIDTNKTGNINGYDEPTAKRTIIFHFPYEFINTATYIKPKNRDKNEFKEQILINDFFSNTDDINSKCFSLIYHYYKNYSKNPDNDVISPLLQEIRDKFISSVCIISNFLEECCVQDTDKDCKISCEDLWKAFEYFQRGNNKKTTKKAFYTRLEGLGFSKKKVKMYRKNEKDAKLPYGFVGLKLTAENHAGETHTSYYATKELANQYSFKHYSTGSNEDTEEELDEEIE